MVLFDFFTVCAMVILMTVSKREQDLRMEYKQPEIISELERRIADGIYAEKLPTSAELAAEFCVNIKTVNKALGRMVRKGEIVRKRHVGTLIVKKEKSSFAEPRLVEVLYEGFPTIFTHPFWGDIWEGMVSALSRHQYRPVLNMLNSDPETGLLKTENIYLMPDVPKIVLGITEERLINQIKSMKIPFVTGCDEIDDSDVPQVSFDMRRAIEEAVNHLFSLGCSRIAFIGLTGSLVNQGNIQKYRSFSRALQKKCRLDPDLIYNVRPLSGAGRIAMQKILDRTSCDAVFAAYDHQLPDIYEVLKEHDLEHIPVIGCDGLDITGVPDNRYAVISPRRMLGEVIAETLVGIINNESLCRQQKLESVFGVLSVSGSSDMGEGSV